MFDWLLKKKPNMCNIYYNVTDKQIVIFDSYEDTACWYYCVERDLPLEQVSERFNFWKDIYKVKQ